jgi:hypothetical protein
MADNKQLPPTGTGTADIVVATDEIAGVDYQRIKLVDGTDGATTGAKVSSEGNLQTITPNRDGGSATLDADDEALTVTADSMSSVVFQVTALTLDGAATLVPEASVDGGTTWGAVYAAVVDDSIPTNGEFIVANYAVIGSLIRVTAPGSEQIRLRLNNRTSGAVTLVANAAASLGNSDFYVSSSDGQIVPAAPAAFVYPNVYNGTSWDRQRGDSTNGMLVNLGANNDVTVTGTVTANLAAGSNNIGDVDVLSIAGGDNNIGNVDIVSVPSPLSTTGHGTAAAAHRVELPTDGTGVVGLNAGTNNIGDVDVLTVPSPLSTAGNGTAATAHRVTIASDSTGVIGVTQSGTWDEVGINDSGNSITVDGTVALGAGSANIGDVDVLTVPAPLSTTGGGTEAAALRVTVANNSTGLLPVSLASVPSHAVTNAGTFATQTVVGGVTQGVVDETGASAVDAAAVGGGTPHDSVDSGNPLKMGWKAANAFPTAVANNDRANGISDLFGRQMVSHIDPAQQIHTNKTYTTTQTGTDVIDPTAGKKIAVTSVVLGAYGTTAGRVILWFGDNADTTFSQDTDQVLLAASFAPSATSKPGLVFTPSVPVVCTTADRELHITTDAGLSIDVTIESYEF